MDPASSALPIKGIKSDDIIIKIGIGSDAENLLNENSLESSRTTTGKD
tara:strand:+ start:437 stop:580 length:144 start_codon:yes stop_codon:yes gene_type:complete